jgi:hypothetical protein
MCNSFCKNVTVGADFLHDQGYISVCSLVYFSLAFSFQLKILFFEQMIQLSEYLFTLSGDSDI